MGRDAFLLQPKCSHFDFNPLAPCGARPPFCFAFCQRMSISIHSPRVGRDPCDQPGTPPQEDFNPLAPCGARQKQKKKASFYWVFQSTRPVWGETAETHKEREIVSYVFTKSVVYSELAFPNKSIWAAEETLVRVRSERVFPAASASHPPFQIISTSSAP